MITFIVQGIASCYTLHIPTFILLEQIFLHAYFKLQNFKNEQREISFTKYFAKTVTALDVCSKLPTTNAQYA